MDAPNIDYWLGRKYALLQQQADASTSQAATQRIGVTAAANLDNTRAGLMPAESLATIARTKAETGLVGQQANWYGREAGARIRSLDAGTAFTGTQNKVLTRESLTPVSQLFGGSIAGYPTMFRLSQDDPSVVRR